MHFHPINCKVCLQVLYLPEDNPLGSKCCEEVLCTQRLPRSFAHIYVPTQSLARETFCLMSRLLATLCLAHNAWRAKFAQGSHNLGLSSKLCHMPVAHTAIIHRPAATVLGASFVNFEEAAVCTSLHAICDHCYLSVDV